MKEDAVFLQHIRDCLQQIREYTASGKSAFLADRKTQDAVLRNLEIIGEAVKNLSAATKNSCPEIAWKQIAGMRDVLIHHYFGVKLDAVWEVVEQHLPKLQAAIDALQGGERIT